MVIIHTAHSRVDFARQNARRYIHTTEGSFHRGSVRFQPLENCTARKQIRQLQIQDICFRNGSTVLKAQPASLGNRVASAKTTMGLATCKVLDEMAMESAYRVGVLRMSFLFRGRRFCLPRAEAMLGISGRARLPLPRSRVGAGVKPCS